MQYMNFKTGIALLVMFLSICNGTAQAIDRPWSDWYQLKDEALNGIWFSWKCSDVRCEWRWDNRYKSEVKISYSLRLIDAGGVEKLSKGEQRLASGPSESPEFVLVAKELIGVEVAIIEPKYTGPKSTAYVASSTRDVDEENRIQELKNQEVQRQRLEDARDKARRNEREREDAQLREEQRLAHKRAEDAEFQEKILDFGRTISNAVVQGSQQVEDARMQRYARERAQAEEQQRREREELRRQQDEQRQRERDAEERRREAETKRQMAELERQERERLAEQKKREACQYMTSSVRAQISHPTGINGKDGVTADADGYLIVPGEMNLFMANTSSSKLICKAAPVRSGVLIGADEKIIALQPYEDNIGKGRFSRSTWWGGYGSTDSVRFSCIVDGSGGDKDCNGKALYGR